MKRHAFRVEATVTPYQPARRVHMHLGTDRWSLTPDEARTLADQLHDAADRIEVQP